MNEDALANALVEAIASWRVRLPEAREGIAQAADAMLLAGDDRASLVAFASAYPDTNAFAIDILIERVVDELNLHDDLQPDPKVIAIRWLCRRVIAGETAPREVATWVHQQFGHESESDLISELAVLDDDYDLTEGSTASQERLDLRVWELARAIISH